MAFNGMSATTFGNDPRVYFRGVTHIHELAWNGGKWEHRTLTQELNVPAELMPAPNCPISATNCAVGNLRVYYIANNNHIVELGNSGHWDFLDVTKIAGATPTCGSALSAIPKSGHNPRVYYMEAGGNVAELCWAGKWQYTCVTKDAKASAAAGNALAATTMADGSPRVYFRTNSTPSMVNELWWGAGTWHERPIAKEANAPAVASDALAAFVAKDVLPYVYFQTPTGKISELRCDGKWHYRAISDELKAPPADGLGLAAFPYSNEPRVYYRAKNGEVMEIATSGGANGLRNLSQETKATPAAGQVISAISIPDPRVYYFTELGDVHELACAKSGWHTRSLTENIAA